MLKQKGFVLSVLVIALLVTAGPVAGADVDWDQVKSVWNTLTMEEQAAYRALMPEEWSKPSKEAPGVVRVLGQVVQPTDKTPGDTCAAATYEISALPFSDSGDTSPLTDDYDLDDATNVSCPTGFDSNGPDNAYRVQVDVTCDIMVQENAGNYDVVLWAVTDCSDTDNSCVGSSDAGNPENFTFTATAGTDYWVIVDGWAGQGGAYTLDLTEATATGCQLIPVELHSFSID